MVFALPVLVNAHQFYISVTSIKHEAETQKIKVRVKLFINDLEESIFQQSGTRIGLWKNKPIANYEDYIKGYLTSKLSITINNSQVPLTYLKHRVESAEVLEDYVLYCEFEANNISTISSLTISNRLLTEAFDSQTNIINVKANNTRKTINLNKRIPEETILFED